VGGAKMREYVIILPQEFYEAHNASTNKYILTFFYFNNSNKEYTTGFI
jgi:hypothetical protein